MIKLLNLRKNMVLRVFVTDNPPNFHINKQIAIEKAKKDFILQLDADEVVLKRTWLEEVREVLSDRQS